MNIATLASGAMLKRIAWGIIAVGTLLMLRALWLGMHLKEHPDTRSVMMQWLAGGVGAYMIGRFLLIRLRWIEKKRKKAA